MPSCRAAVRLLACAVVFVGSAGVVAAQQHTDFGALSIQVRPADAEVFIDGQRWVVAGEPLVVQMAPGRHHVEIRARGYQPFQTEVTITAGETTPLNVSLGTAEAPPEVPVPPQMPPAHVPTRPLPPSPGMVETESEDGMAFGPEFRVADVNHETGALLGGSVGYVFAGQFFVGGGGYWQLNSTNGWHLAYGGPIVEWRFFPRRTVGFNLRALVGGGALYADYNHYYGPHGGYGPHHGYYYGPYYHSEGFFVAEPEARVTYRITPFIQLQGGVGYRATPEDGLSGVSGGISLQFGK